MIINAPNLAFFFTTLDTSYGRAYEAKPTHYQEFATIYPAMGEAWLQGWIGMLNKLRVWKGPRVVRSPAPQTYLAPIRPFELTEGIDQFKLMDDSYGIYAPMFTMMGENAKKWPDYTIRDLIQGNGDFAGAAQIGLDGLTFWNTAHPVDYYDAGAGTYPNDYGTAGVSVNGVTVGGSLSIPSYTTIWQDMASRKDESGEAVGAAPDKLMVPSQLNFAGKSLTQGQIFAPNAFAGVAATAVGSMSNPLLNSTDLLHNEDLDSQPGAFYMLCTKRAIRPFGWALRQAPVGPIVRNAPTDPAVFDAHTYLYGIWARGTAVWGFSWMASRSGIDV